MEKIKHKRFIAIYENRIKEYRDAYYKNLIVNNKTVLSLSPFLKIFFLIPFVISIFILFTYHFTISGYIFAFLVIVIGQIMIRVMCILLKIENQNTYLDEIRKYGYLSIDNYERKLKEYITGENGYYHFLLQDMLNKYNLNYNTRKIYGINGEEYLIWCNEKQDRIHLLNIKLNIKPEIETIKMANIRYFRVDYIQKKIILKTDITEYSFRLDSIDVMNEMMRNKRFENLIQFTPEDYINDFELYMHTVRDKESKEEERQMKQFMNYLSHLFLCIVISVSLMGVYAIVEQMSGVLSIIQVILFFIINLKIKNLFTYRIKKGVSEKEWISSLNSNLECLERFRELKFSLGINDNFDKVYTTEGACYLVWVANGYFHVFLNIVYFNVVYMAIKISDVAYYKVIQDTCEVKLKDKTLLFKKEAAEVFAKILPNKDFEWLKGYQNK